MHSSVGLYRGIGLMTVVDVDYAVEHIVSVRLRILCNENVAQTNKYLLIDSGRSHCHRCNFLMFDEIA